MDYKKGWLTRQIAISIDKTQNFMNDLIIFFCSLIPFLPCSISAHDTICYHSQKECNNITVGIEFYLQNNDTLNSNAWHFRIMVKDDILFVERQVLNKDASTTIWDQPEELPYIIPKKLSYNQLCILDSLLKDSLIEEERTSLVDTNIWTCKLMRYKNNFQNSNNSSFVEAKPHLVNYLLKLATEIADLSSLYNTKTNITNVFSCTESPSLRIDIFLHPPDKHINYERSWYYHLIYEEGMLYLANRMEGNYCHCLKDTCDIYYIKVTANQENFIDSLVKETYFQEETCQSSSIPHHIIRGCTMIINNEILFQSKYFAPGIHNPDLLTYLCNILVTKIDFRCGKL